MSKNVQNNTEVKTCITSGS